MAKLHCTLENHFISEFELTKNKMTIGRNPKSDIVLESPTISGSHAQITKVGVDYLLEDTKSTNGTFVNMNAIKKHVLKVGDTIEIGHFKLMFSLEALLPNPDKNASLKLRSAESILTTSQSVNTISQEACVLMISGAKRGERQPLKKTLSTFGQSGLQVAVITKREQAYFISQLEGTLPVTINAVPLHELSYQLQHEDVIDVAGTQMQFLIT